MLLLCPPARSGFITLLLAACLASCGDTPTITATNTAASTASPIAIATDDPAASPTDSPTESPSPTETPSDEAEPTPTEVSTPGSPPSLTAGQYCYSTKTKTLDAAIRLTVADQGKVTGDSAATIQDKDQGYYSSYRQKITGQLSGDELAAETTTWIEYDMQKKSEPWTVTKKEIKTDRDTFTSADCAKVKAKFANEKGLEAKDLTESAKVHRKEVKFKEGTSATVLSNSVVRGDRDLYPLVARGGQMMILSITAPENNAVFDLVSPDGGIVATEQTDLKLPLPSTGEYQIIVGGTRGNASYKLNVEIR